MSSAARLQRLLPDAVLVGGTASAIHAAHRFSRDAEHALPYDLEETELSEYKNLAPRWHDWQTAKAACANLATVIFDRVCELERGSSGRATRTRG